MSEYTSTARWTKGRSGIADAQSVDQRIAFSAPVEFQGQSGMWTPEHFLVAAVAGCLAYTTDVLKLRAGGDCMEETAFAVSTLLNAQGWLVGRWSFAVQRRIVHQQDQQSRHQRK